MKRIKFSLSKLCIFLIPFVWFTVLNEWQSWEKNHINNDVVSYYGYLPAIYIYKDVSLKFIEDNPDLFAGKYWPERAPNGGRVIKTTMGLSILYTPFFLIGHQLAKALDYPATGYSAPYQVCLLVSCLFYLLLGLWYLRKLLLRYFSEAITALTLVSVFFGTNLFYYSTNEALLAHAYLFSLLAVMAYLTVKWHEAPRILHSLLLGIIMGLAVLIRPTMIIFLLFPLLYNVRDKQSLLAKIKLLNREKRHVFVMAVVFVLTGTPQLIYWKYVTGQWLFYSYTGEKFYFAGPHLVEGLFGYRKGWLLYTPLMAFSIPGLFFLKRYIPSFTFSVAVPFLISMYVILCWWAWWYGGSFGQRAFVDFYGILALPVAAFYRAAWEKKLSMIVFVSLALLLVGFNLFQTWQYQKGLIHFDGMTKKSYWINFAKTHTGDGWWESLEQPDYARAMKGLPEKIKQPGPVDKIDFEEAFSSYEMAGINREYVFAGKGAFKLDGARKTSPSISIRLSHLPPGEDLSLENTVYFYSRQDLEQNPCTLVVAFEGAAKTEHRIPFSEAPVRLPGTWNKLEFTCKIPADKTQYTSLSVYIQYDGGSDMFIDDLSATLKK